MVRLYREQSGGKGSVKKDREERRILLNETLTRLRDNSSGPEELRRLAESTLSRI